MSFSVIVADPPWQPRDALPGKTRGASRQYKTMPVSELCRYLPDLEENPWPRTDVSQDAILLFWRLASMQQEALNVVDSWGFRVTSEIVWRKLTVNGLPWFGMGRTVRASHETALVCVRGRSSRVIRAKNVRSVFEAKVPHTDSGYIHSAKPDEFFSLVEELCGPASPETHLELFARKRRPMWTQIGDQLEGELVTERGASTAGREEAPGGAEGVAQGVGG